MYHLFLHEEKNFLISILRVRQLYIMYKSNTGIQPHPKKGKNRHIQDGNYFVGLNFLSLSFFFLSFSLSFQSKEVFWIFLKKPDFSLIALVPT